jgi:signal transduction histidine kinase
MASATNISATDLPGSRWRRAFGTSDGTRSKLKRLRHGRYSRALLIGNAVALAILLCVGVGLRSYRAGVLEARIAVLESETARAALLMDSETVCPGLRCLDGRDQAADAANAIASRIGRDVSIFLEGTSGNQPFVVGRTLRNAVPVPVPETLPRAAMPRSAFGLLRLRFAQLALGRAGASEIRPLEGAAGKPSGVVLTPSGLTGYSIRPVQSGGRSAILVVEDQLIDPIGGAFKEALLPLGLALLLIASVSAFLLTAKMTQPLRVLTNAAERVRSQAGMAGTIRLPDFDDRADDVGRLSRSFRAMMGALVDRIETIDNFAADVSHELKNPLTSIKSAVETLDKCKTAEQRERLLQVIASDVSRMDRLISDIAGASRMDAQLATEARHPVDASKLLEDIAVGYNAVSDAGGPRISFEDISSGSEKIYAAPAALGRVFRNLIDNAVSFSPPGGEVRIVLEKAQTGAMILVTVTDQGPGVPPDNLETIFDRFYTSRPRGTTFGANSGLGLAIARQIVESHNGAIWCQNLRDDEGEDEDAKGARFSVALPLCQQGA